MQRRLERRLSRAFLPLLLLMSCAAPAAQTETKVQTRSTVVWEEPAPWFGGFSGAEVSVDGNHLIAVSDRGRVLRARLLREGGKLVGVALQQDASLAGPDKRPLRNKRRDAEGLALGEDGAVYVSFEHGHRVMRLDPDTGVTTPLPRHPDFARLQPNSGLEALAIHPDGRLFTLPERPDSTSGTFPLYAFNGKKWSISAHIPSRGPFLAVGADFGPDGSFYLLERTVTPLGFRSRIRSFNLDAKGLAESTLMTSGPSQYDNLEALSVWQDAKGQTRLTLVSDDNFFPLQETQVVELTLAKTAPRP
jgi:hypothetical protein